MIYVALVLAAALVVVVVSFAGIIRSLIRQHARERDLLTNQLLHAVGTPWQAPPAVDDRLARLAGAREERQEYEAAIRFTPSPEQHVSV